MFGLSWGQIAIIVLVGVFVLGPERIPTAVTWVLTNLRKLRSMAAGAQAELRKEIGPELEELRRQVADLQSLKEIQELRDLRDLHPKRLIGKNILGDEFSGGITGFLGLNQPLTGASAPASETAGTGPNGSSGVNGSANGDTAVSANGSTALNGSPSGENGSAAPNGTSGLNAAASNASANGLPSPSWDETAAPPYLPPLMAKLAAPKVVGGTSSRVVSRALDAGERPPFDPDGT